MYYTKKMCPNSKIVSIENCSLDCSNSANFFQTMKILFKLCNLILILCNYCSNSVNSTSFVQIVQILLCKFVSNRTNVV